jgi:hypothetical protein
MAAHEIAKVTIQCTETGQRQPYRHPRHHLITGNESNSVAFLALLN